MGPAVWLTRAIQLAVLAQSTLDPNLRVETVVGGLNSPTTMAFLGANDILALQKSDGRVRRVTNGILQAGSVLDLAVNFASERGLLGIALDPDFQSNGYVYLYHTASSTGFDTNVAAEVGSHFVDRYTWNGAQLVNRQVIYRLPATPGPNHDGGIVNFGPDGKLYFHLGDLNHRGQLQNQASGPPDDTSVIFRLNRDGSIPTDNPFYNAADPTNPLGRYFAYGIRNSFGFTFDPLTGKMWQTENGPDVFDEINQIDAGMNSGWTLAMGPVPAPPPNLVMFPGAFYRNPLFSWRRPVGVTGIASLNSDRLGCQYQNDFFVLDSNNGYLYRFKLNAARTDLVFTSQALQDRVADDNADELQEVRFGAGFSIPTDVKTGPDGLLYIVSLGAGRIYRIVPSGSITPCGGTPTTTSTTSTTSSSTTGTTTTTSTSTTSSSSTGSTTTTSTSTTTSSTSTTIMVVNAVTHFPMVSDTAAEIVGLAVVNPSLLEGRILFRGYSNAGVQVATATARLAAGEQMAVTVPEMFAAFPGSSPATRSRETPVKSGRVAASGQLPAWLEMESDNPSLLGFFLNFDSNLQRMDGADAGRETLTQFILPVIENAAVTVVNPGSAPVTLSISSVDDFGRTATTFADRLAPYARLALESNLFRPSPDFRGYLRADASGGLVALESFGNSETLSVLNAQGAASGAEVLYAPQYVVGGGFSSRLDLVNLESAPVSAVLSFLGDDGRQIGDSKTIEIAARGHLRVSDASVFGVTPGALLIQGYVRIESRGGKMIGAVGFSDLLSQRAATALPLVSALTQEMFFSQIAQNDTYYTGLAVLNPQGQASDVTVTAFDSSGRIVASGQTSLAAGGRFSGTLAEIVGGLPAMSRGYFRVTSTRPVAGFALFGTADGEVLSAIPPSRGQAPNSGRRN